jgi:putative phosphoesterase
MAPNQEHRCGVRREDELQMPSSRHFTVGLISDTHGLLRPEAVDALRGSDFIIHAGDIGDPQVLGELSRLAPVTAIRGNVDKGSWASSLPDTEVLKAGAVFIFVLHNVADLDLDPVAAGFQAIVSGHSHRPAWREKDGVLFVNPGEAPGRAASPCRSRSADSLSREHG